MFFENEKDILGDISADNDLISWDDVLAKEEKKETPSPQQGKKTNQDGIVDLRDELNFTPGEDEPINEEELTKILNDDSMYTQQATYDSNGNGHDFQDDNSMSIEENALNESLNMQMNKKPPHDFMPRKEQQKKSSNMLPLLLLLLVLLLAGGGYYGLSFYAEENDLTIAEIFKPQTTQDKMNEMTPQDLQNRNDQAIQEETSIQEEENIPVVNEDEAQEIVPEDTTKEESEAKTKVVQVHNTGRINPFQPIGKYLTVTVPKTTLNYDGSGVPKPPEEYGIEDVNTRKMVTITISGVMYDNVSPSAIITYDNDDYFVQKGDKLDEFSILDIGQGFVIIGLGKNTYKASIGENFKVDVDIDGSAKFLPEGQGKQYFSSNHTSTSDVSIKTRN